MSSESQRFEFKMPDPGEGLTEAELSAWHVEVGAEVEEDDVLCEVETDKALVDIPVPYSGEVLELRAEPGDMVKVGEVIAVFETADAPASQTVAEDAGEESAETASESSAESGAGAAETVSESSAENGASAGADADASEPAASGDGRTFAAPSTRRYAREQGVELAAVEGSGPGGRILRDDVDAYLDGDSEPATGAASAQADSEPAESEATAVETGDDEDGPVVRRPLRGLRKTIADNMVESKQTIPHVTSGFKADAEELVELKERLDETVDAPVTYTTLIMKAVVPALKEFPILNASIDDETDEIVEKHYYNLGIATHTEDGLMVPVIDGVDRKSIAELGTELADLVERTRERSVDIEELQGGTFTITNTGGFSEHGTFGTPIIRHPEVAIMGVGRIQNEAVAVNDTDTEVRKTVSLSLSYDHRLVDGVTATQFMEYVIEGIEDTDVLLSRL